MVRIKYCLHFSVNVTELLICLIASYTVVLNGKEAIHEAFIKHSLDFSDRPKYFIDATVFNIHAKGKLFWLSILLLLLLSCAKSHMLSASRRQPHLLHVSAVDHRQTWSMDKS